MNLVIKKQRFEFFDNQLLELKYLIPENNGLNIFISYKKIEKLSITGT